MNAQHCPGEIDVELLTGLSIHPQVDVFALEMRAHHFEELASLKPVWMCRGKIFIQSLDRRAWFAHGPFGGLQIGHGKVSENGFGSAIKDGEKLGVLHAFG